MASLTQTLNIPGWVEEICMGWIRLPQVMLHKPVTHGCLNWWRTLSLQCARSKNKESNFSSHAYYCKLTYNYDYGVGLTRFKSSHVSNSSIQGRETYFWNAKCNFKSQNFIKVSCLEFCTVKKMHSMKQNTSLEPLDKVELRITSPLTLVLQQRIPSVVGFFWFVWSNDLNTYFCSLRRYSRHVIILAC